MLCYAMLLHDAQWHAMPLHATQLAAAQATPGNVLVQHRVLAPRGQVAHALTGYQMAGHPPAWAAGCGGEL